MKRYALVSLRGTTAAVIEKYLPANYTIGGFLEADADADDLRQFGACVLVEGRDHAGWTLHQYVIPRLASGLIGAKEIDLSHPVMKLVIEIHDGNR